VAWDCKLLEKFHGEANDGAICTEEIVNQMCHGLCVIGAH
jgi:hypothetical protein